MRDKNRIEPFLKVIQECWEKVPDWRFGQLIENFKREENIPDLFFIEDDKFEKKIKEMFSKND